MDDVPPFSAVSSVLILKADRLCAAAFAQAAERAFPGATIQRLGRVREMRAALSVVSVDLLVTGVLLPDDDVIDFLAENQKGSRRSSTVPRALEEIHRKLNLHHKGESHELGAKYGVVRFTPGGVVRPGLALLNSVWRRRVPLTVPA